MSKNIFSLYTFWLNLLFKNKKGLLQFAKMQICVGVIVWGKNNVPSYFLVFIQWLTGQEVFNSTNRDILIRFLEF